jgi:hypothetical protein
MRSYRVADLPVTLAAVPLSVPSVIPTCQDIGDLLPAITKPQTRFHRSKQRLVREEHSEKRRRAERGQILSARTQCRRSGPGYKLSRRWRVETIVETTSARGVPSLFLPPSPGQDGEQSMELSSSLLRCAWHLHRARSYCPLGLFSPAHNRYDPGRTRNLSQRAARQKL